jgi:uncharacterized membrane protein
MDGERLSPLTYSVDAPEGETSAQKAILISALAVAVATLVAIVGGWVALGKIEAAEVVKTGGPVLVLLSGPVVALLVSRGSFRKAKQTALVVVTGFTLLATIFTSTTLGNVKWAMPQVRRVVDGIELPPGFRLLDQEEFGDRMCRRGCPSIERRYAAPPGDPDPVSTLILAMFDQGWQQVADVPPALATGARKGEVTAQLGENEPHVVELRITRDS